MNESMKSLTSTRSKRVHQASKARTSSHPPVRERPFLVEPLCGHGRRGHEHQTQTDSKGHALGEDDMPQL